MSVASQLSADARTLATKHADELRECWQGRVLRESSGLLRALTCTMLAHSYYEAMDVLLRVLFGKDFKITPPCFTGTARLTIAGTVVCDMLTSSGLLLQGVRVFDSEHHLVGVYRYLADDLKLNDDDRRALFVAVQRWVSRDDRIKPSVDYAGRA